MLGVRIESSGASAVRPRLRASAIRPPEGRSAPIVKFVSLLEPGQRLAMQSAKCGP
jgi:hypothetical protein